MILLPIFLALLLPNLGLGGILSAQAGTNVDPVRSSKFPDDIPLKAALSYYILEGSAPYNLADRLSYTTNVLAGGMVTTHAAIGIFVEGTGDSFSIELVSSDGDYGSIFFPDLTTLSSTCENSAELWGNIGEITVTRPLDPNVWNLDHFFASSNGQAYYQLIGWLNNNMNSMRLIQPVYAVKNPPTPVGQQGTFSGSGPVFDLDSVVVKAQDTFLFAKSVADEIIRTGATLYSFRPIMHNAFIYPIGSATKDLQAVSLLGHSPERTKAIEWFKNKKDCASNLIAESWGLEDYMKQLRSCYRTDNTDSYTVYFYLNSTAVWKAEGAAISMTGGVQFSSPVILRFVAELLQSANTGTLLKFNTTDIVLYSLSVLVIFIYIFAGLYYRLNRKKQRRRLSIAGEAIAKASVEAFAETYATGASAQAIANYYYEERKDKAWTLKKWYRYWAGYDIEEEEEIERMEENRKSRMRAMSTVLHRGTIAGSVTPSQLDYSVQSASTKSAKSGSTKSAKSGSTKSATKSPIHPV